MEEEEEEEKEERERLEAINHVSIYFRRVARARLLALCFPAFVIAK